MNIFENKVFFRYLFVAVAMIIAFGSLIISHFLVKDLAQEENSKIKIWAEATKELAESDENINMNLIVLILESNNTIPVILYDKKDEIYTSVNIELPETDEQLFLKNKANSFSKNHAPIVIKADGFEQFVYYDDSHTLKRLQMYPYIQLGVLAIFVLTSFFALLSTKRMEQDRLWVGLSKETAHQLGTPISSLMAWIEYLKMQQTEASIVDDMEKDVIRLQTITDRFSKIGSAPALKKTDLGDEVRQILTYLEPRISKKVKFHIDFPSQPVYVNLSESLFGWVIENLTKNAVDAMTGAGEITFSIQSKAGVVIFDIADTGKGIPKSKQKSIFSTGYTTKARGWGLGLPLAKRIIESYHKGKIYVKLSDASVGTVFRIELKSVN